MKIKNSYSHRPLILMAQVAAVLAIFLTLCFSGSEARADEQVRKAYELRMQGKVDEAKTLLEQMLSENPKNAEAHYEMARINMYMMVGDFKKMMDYLAEAQQSIDKAILYDPQNVSNNLLAGHIAFFNYYISSMKKQPDAKEKASKLIEAYETTLKLKPDYHQVMLYLVELNRVIPEDMGGSLAKAEQYATKLESVNDIYGAKARSFLLLIKEAEENVDESKRTEKQIGYWKDVLTKHPQNAEALAELGRAYLGANKADDAASCIEEAVKIDPEKRTLFLDMGRYCSMYSGMMNKKDPALAQSALTMSESYLTKYMEAEPRIPLKAFALGILGRVKMQQNDQTKSQELLAQAQKMDPYYSKASGVPNPDLFIPPGEISHTHRYLFLPY